MVSKKTEYMRKYRALHKETTTLQSKQASERYRARERAKKKTKPPQCLICGKPIMPFQGLPLCYEHGPGGRQYYKKFNGRPITQTCNLCYLEENCRLKPPKEFKGYWKCNLVGD